mmetsp:Transcript_8050/g.8276  ORF Transcript_8050/g.8276 Transcript_8050/m.8276 type:complete len:121 (-) Transcript_8050:54-416(-)
MGRIAHSEALLGLVREVRQEACGVTTVIIVFFSSFPKKHIEENELDLMCAADCVSLRTITCACHKYRRAARGGVRWFGTIRQFCVGVESQFLVFLRTHHSAKIKPAKARGVFGFTTVVFR